MTKPLRFSHLKMMAESPAHYKWAVDHDFEPTGAMRVGTIAHALILGESVPYAIYDGKRQGNAWKDFQLANPGRELFTIAEYHKALPMAEAVAKCSDAAPYLIGEAEQQISWTYCGRPASSRLDIRGATFVADVKTTVSSKPARFGLDAFYRGYHAQLDFYRKAAGLAENAPCYIVAVESKEPYCVTVFQADEALLQQGAAQCRGWFERLLVCEANDHWPGYASGVQALSAPDRDDINLTFGDEADEEEAA